METNDNKQRNHNIDIKRTQKKNHWNVLKCFDCLEIFIERSMKISNDLKL